MFWCVDAGCNSCTVPTAAAATVMARMCLSPKRVQTVNMYKLHNYIHTVVCLCIYQGMRQVESMGEQKKIFWRNGNSKHHMTNYVLSPTRQLPFSSEGDGEREKKIANPHASHVISANSAKCILSSFILFCGNLFADEQIDEKKLSYRMPWRADIAVQ